MLLTGLLTLLSFSSQAQNPLLDDLKEVCSNGESEARISACNKVSDFYFNKKGNLPVALNYALKALKAGENGKTFYNLASIYTYNSLIDQSDPGSLGLGKRESEERASEYAGKACKLLDPDGCSLAANFYLKNGNREKYLEILKISAEDLKHGPSALSLFQELGGGKNNVRLLELTCKNARISFSDALSCFQAAETYKTAEKELLGSSKDAPRKYLLPLYARAATSSGYKIGCFEAAKILDNSPGKVKETLERTRFYYNWACENSKYLGKEQGEIACKRARELSNFPN